MKNILIFIAVFLSFFINILYSEAKVVVPPATIKIVVKTEGSDDSFKYFLDTYHDHVFSLDDRLETELVTINSLGEGKFDLNILGPREIRLSSSLVAGWLALEPTCTSTNSTEIFSTIDQEINFTIHPNSVVTCTYIYKQKKTPVLIVPGILSSILNKTDSAKTELWPNIWTALFGWPGDKYLDYLSLNQIGQPNPSSPVVATDIFRKVGMVDFFEGLISRLEAAGYDEGQSLFTFPYDWRRDIRENTLSEKVDQILQQTSADKINIIAHSMGGLLVKNYIKHSGTSTVDKFIDIATPHLGAPSAFKTLTYGDDMGIKFGIFGLNSNEVKSISQNMPSAYQLLPSRNYFSTTSPDYKYYLYDMDNVDGNEARGRLDYLQSKQFMINTGRNDILLNTAPNIHNDLDFMNAADFGVRAYNIVGCGVPTIGKFFLLGKKNDQGNYYDVSYISGDGTVPEKSARSFPAIKEYQISGVNHSALPSATDTDSIITDILLNENTVTSTSSPDCKLPDGDLLSFHGPVKVDIYDSDNNHAGPILGTGFEQSISGIIYDYIDNNIFVYLPLGKEYKVKISSPKKGTASSHIKKLIDEQIISSAYYQDIPLGAASTTLEINLPSTELIWDGQTLPPSSTSSSDTLLDLEPPVTNISTTSLATSTTITFSSNDSDVLQTEYSTDGGQSYIVASTTSPLLITTAGTTTVVYQSTDAAGNLETPRHIDIYIPIISTTSIATSTILTVPPIVSTTTTEVSTSTPIISTTTPIIQVVAKPIVSKGGSGSLPQTISTTAVLNTNSHQSTSSPIISAIISTTSPPITAMKIKTPKISSSTETIVRPAPVLASDMPYASVVESKAESSIFYRLSLVLLIMFIILLIILRQKRRNKVKYYHDRY